MPKIKLADKREIPSIPLKQISQERVGSPYLTRVEQQHVQEGELPFKKLRIFEDTDLVSGFSITSATVTSNFFNALLTTEVTKPKVLTEVNIYVGTDNDINYLWPNGISLSSSQKNFSLTLLPQITMETTLASDLRFNQQRIGFNLRNQSSDTHTYYIYFRFTIL